MYLNFVLLSFFFSFSNCCFWHTYCLCVSLLLYLFCCPFCNLLHLKICQISEKLHPCLHCYCCCCCCRGRLLFNPNSNKVHKSKTHTHAYKKKANNCKFEICVIIKFTPRRRCQFSADTLLAIFSDNFLALPHHNRAVHVARYR